MYRVNKEEAKLLRDIFGKGVTLYRTCKQKSQRHHYLCSEEPYAWKVVNEYRGGMAEEEIRKKYAGRVTYTPEM